MLKTNNVPQLFLRYIFSFLTVSAIHHLGRTLKDYYHLRQTALFVQ